MTPTTLLVMLLGAVVGGAVLLLVVTLRGTVPKPAQPTTSRGPIERIGRQGLLGLAAGLIALLATRWPALAVGTGVLVAFWPAMFGGLREERNAIARLEGLAAWTESLRDTIAGAVGLEQAIPATAYAAAPSIRSQLRLLVDRLRVRVPMPVALQRFADDLDDPSADLVVAALILNARLRGPGLRQVLTTLADSARAELDMRQRVMASRASTRRSVQIIVGVTILFVVGLPLLNPTYVEPYSTPAGQVVLAVVLGIFALGFLWMRRLSRLEMPKRFLVAAPSATGAGTPVGADGRSA
jgi:Flp pilus assembly protein TadB